MQIAQELAGYSLGEADLSAPRHGQEDPGRDGRSSASASSPAPSSAASAKPQADFIFDLLAKFADYGFNKTHAAAYAMVSYQTAYLKANYPVEFLAASMTLDMSQHRQARRLPRRRRMRLGIEVVPPSVMTLVPRLRGRRQPHLLFAGGDQGRRRRGGRAHRRRQRGEKPFAEPRRFLRAHRSAASSASACFESLIMAGALDCFGHDRAAMMAGLERMIGHGPARPGERASGQSRHVRAWPASRPQKLYLPAADAWLPAERLHREFQAVGFYLSAHPLDEYKRGAGQDAGPELGRILGRP